MTRGKPIKKKPSRAAYEESHPTVSCPLDRETYDRLNNHLKTTGCSFANFVKDSLGREETMVEERVAKLAAGKIEERETPARDLELYDLVLNLARWSTLLWVNLPHPKKIPCPQCLFPCQVQKNRQPRTVTLELIEDGSFQCPECGVTLKNAPQLAWVLLVNRVEEELRREESFRPQERDQ